MWKIFFKYKDKSKVTVTGKRDITKEQLIKYQARYGATAESAIYQQYPKKIYPAIRLIDKISQEYREPIIVDRKGDERDE